jgi:hypothetical protein
MAGAAHLHESADHHEESRGLHLDHTHLSDSADHGHGHDSPHDGHARLDGRHVGHHGGDVLYLSATTLRLLDSSLRSLPAAVSVGATIDPPSAIEDRVAAMPGRPRDPPPQDRTRPRAPPA